MSFLNDFNRFEKAEHDEEMARIKKQNIMEELKKDMRELAEAYGGVIHEMKEMVDGMFIRVSKKMPLSFFRRLEIEFEGSKIWIIAEGNYLEITIEIEQN